MGAQRVRTELAGRRAEAENVAKGPNKAGRAETADNTRHKVFISN